MQRVMIGIVACFCVALSAVGVHAQTEKVFFGNLHSHTSYSDGSGKPEDAYKAAQKAGLDFMAITEHNHSQCEQGAADRADGVMIALDHSLYTGPVASSLIPTATRLTTATFVALYGQEFSSISKGNHMNVLDVPDVIDEAAVPNGEFGTLVNSWLPNHKDSTGQIAILEFNHPGDCHNQCIPAEYGQDDFGSQANWIQTIDQIARLIEVENGPGLTNGTGQQGTRMEPGYLHYLSLGFHLAPAADQDNHYKTWGTLTDARTAVIAPALTKQDLLGAIRARHVYATEDKNLSLIFHVNGHLCGDRIAPPAKGTELQIDYSIADKDEPDASYEIQPFIGKVGQEAQPSNPVAATDTGGTLHPLTGVTYTSDMGYLFFKVVQTDQDGQDFAWTAPVWFDGAAGAGGAGPTPAAPQPSASNFVASVNSTIYHVSLQCRDAKRIRPENRVTGAEAMQGRRLHEGCPK